jgi:uncharacterized protein YkwD
VTDTVPAPATEAAVTEAPPASPIPAASAESPTPTPQATRPPNAADCTNSASFVADVTIPDNSEVIGGANFTKTWRIQNTGTCIWAGDYTLTHYSDQRMNAPASVALPVTFPGQTADISVELTAPTALGTHRANFVIKNPAGLIMKINDDSRLWLIINVKIAATATFPAAATAAGSSPASGATATIAAGSPAPATSSSGGGGSASVTCNYAIDQLKLIDVINAVNAYRKQSGLPDYTVNTQLVRAAQMHANDMACNQFFTHTGSDGSTPASRVAASGYKAAFVSENVYGSYPPLTGEGAVNWWKNDQTDLNHNLNLISDTYTEIGVGYSFFNNYGYYVIVFATP